MKIQDLGEVLFEIAIDRGNDKSPQVLRGAGSSGISDGGGGCGGSGGCGGGGGCSGGSGGCASAELAPNNIK